LSKSTINDLALARETQLLFNYTEGFRPIGDKLNRWRGTIEVNTDSGKQAINIEIFIPLKFPEYPPRIFVLDSNIHHPNLETDGNVLLRITHEWDPEVHVYQVVQALQELFKKVPPMIKSHPRQKSKEKQATVQTKESTTTPKQREVESLQAKITEIQAKIKKKDQELGRIQAEVGKKSNEKVTTIENLEVLLPKDKKKREQLLLQAEKVAISDLLSTLDGKFKDGEINPVDFAKLYRRFSKDLYIAQKKLEEIS
jgi:ubiquitin-protein ligase